MAYGRNTFRDPATGREYAWQVNHSEEEAVGLERPVEVKGRTGGGYVVQQGADGAIRLRVSGVILHQQQFNEMRDFVLLCKQRTIHFTDFAGDKGEVLITSWQPTRHRTIRNPRDASIPLHYWRYTMELTLIRPIAGSWVGVV